jgi:hypothetical protein
MDNEDPHSDRKRQCSEIRCRMMRELVELGYGEYSILNIVSAAIGAHQESDGPPPKSISTHASAASKAGFWAIMTRNELLTHGENSREFDRRLCLVSSLADGVLGDPKSTFEFDLPGESLSEAILRFSAARRSEGALQTGAVKRREESRPSIEERDKYLCQRGRYHRQKMHHSRVTGRVTYEYSKDRERYTKYPPHRPLERTVVMKILRRAGILPPPKSKHPV